MAAPFQAVIDGLLGLLFPDRCVGCDATGSLLCADCCARLRPYPQGARQMAGRDLAAGGGLDDAAVAFVFEGPMRAAIHRLKYDRIRRMAEPLGDLLAEHLRRHPLPADALVPVPLHERRRAERGFNQSELIAQRLAAQTGLLLTTALVRGRDTAQQVGLDAAARQGNVQGAFGWQGRRPPPPRLLLIDDVLTTGATLGACAEALRSAGAREVRALVLARSSLARA